MKQYCNLWFMLLAKKIKSLSTEHRIYVASTGRKIKGRTMPAQVELMKIVNTLKEDLTKKKNYIWDKREAKELLSYVKESWEAGRSGL